MDLNQILRFAVEQHSFFQRGLSKLHHDHPGSPHRTADNLHPKSTAASISLGNTGHVYHVRFPEFGIVQDADCLDAICTIVVRVPPEKKKKKHQCQKTDIKIHVCKDSLRLFMYAPISSFPLKSGIARCFTFGGSRSRVLHDPAIQPRSDVSKEKYMKKDEQTTVTHFHEELLKLKDLMITKAGQKRAERRHKFMEEFLKESA